MTSAEREQTILDNMSIVKAIALGLRETTPPFIDLNDLIQAGIFGLIFAVDHYKPAYGVPFEMYAKHRIRGAILDSLRENDWASRHTRRQTKEIMRWQRKLEGELMRKPSDSEVAERMGIPLSQYQARKSMMIAPETSSLDQAMIFRGYRGDLSHKPLSAIGFGEFLSGDDHSDDLAKQSEMTKAVADAVANLPKRWKTVIELYYRAEMTMLEIGKVLGVNESRVSQIHGCATKRIKEKLANKGITSVRNFI